MRVHCTAMCVVKKLPVSHYDPVLGLTCLGDELFILRKRNEDHVEVYSTETSQDFAGLRQFTVNNLETRHSNDMTSCPRRRCLFISDSSNSCVHKSALNGEMIARWRVSISPVGLSLTPSSSLLVTCPHSRKLLELCADSGECIRQVQ